MPGSPTALYMSADVEDQSAPVGKQVSAKNHHVLERLQSATKDHYVAASRASHENLLSDVPVGITLPKRSMMATVACPGQVKHAMADRLTCTSSAVDTGPTGRCDRISLAHLLSAESQPDRALSALIMISLLI